MNFLNLIRYKNLLLIALVQILIKYGLLESWGVNGVLTDFQFGLLVLATLAIAAAGNIINDIYDVEIDTVNKPQRVIVGRRVSETRAYQLFVGLNVLGVALGFYLSNSIGKPGFAAVFIVISALLYMYASYLKGVLFVGNILVSVLVALSLLIVPVFDVLPIINTDETNLTLLSFKVIFHYACFAFVINFIREIVKDIQDINGDKKASLKTLPIVLGRKRATTIVFALGVLLSALVIGYMYIYLYYSQEILLYFLFFIVAPLFYFCVKDWNAERAKEYTFLSFFLKVIMFLGICSVAFYPLPQA